MKGYIKNFDFYNMEVEKYWSPTKNINLKELVHSAIYSNEYFGARKVDGNFILFIKDEDGNLIFRTRSKGVNGFLDKINFVPHLYNYLNKLPKGTVLLGEAYLPNNECSKAMTTIFGCLPEKAVKRQEKKENKVHYYIFDCLAYNNNIIMNIPMTERVDKVHLCFSKIMPCPYVEYAEYYEGKQLEEYIGYALAKGYEGVVIQRKDGIYMPGKRPARKSIKVKKEIQDNIDAFITGNYKPAKREYTGKEIEKWTYWENEKTGELKEEALFKEASKTGIWTPITKGYFYGWAGAIEIGVYRDNKIIPIGYISNVTEEVKNEIVKVNNELIYKVVSINCMMIEDDTKKLRHAKIIEWRNDKDWRQCDGHEIWG